MILYYSTGGLKMIYPYMNFPDGTEIVHTQILNPETNPTVEVNFERPTEHGFDSARCELPTYRWINKEGYSDSEIKSFEEFLRNNAHLIFKFAASGGICCA